MDRFMFLSIVLFAAQVAAIAGYVVPEAKVELLKPKGFSVSIPDDDDEIILFAFHGQINQPMEGLEAGVYSRDILRPKNGRWTFTDRKTKLHPCDIIYYWTYVIKDGLGYRRDSQTYLVPGKRRFKLFIHSIFTFLFVFELKVKVKLSVQQHRIRKRQLKQL